MALLSGTVVLVSGVGPGLGRSIALASAREGADLADTDRCALSDFGLTGEQVDERFAGYHRAHT